MERAHDLAAELDHAPVVEHRLLDATARPVARLEHLDVGARGDQVARGGQAGQPRAEHEHVAHQGARAGSGAAGCGAPPSASENASAPPSTPSQPRLAISLAIASRWISDVPSQMRSTRSSR